MIRAMKAVAVVVLLLHAAGCLQKAQPDSTPPEVYVLKWERNPNGTQGAQSQVLPGGQLTVPANWLGPNQADIRVYGKGTHGVRKLTVSGTATGKASTAVNSSGQFFTAPGVLTASFPTFVEDAPAGTTRNFMAFHLGPDVLLNRSCGTRSFQNAPPNAEYFLEAPATWTITATTENGSGLQTTGTFIIKVQ